MTVMWYVIVPRHGEAIWGGGHRNARHASVRPCVRAAIRHILLAR